MVRFAVSNIALPAYDHAAELGRLAELGLAGIEVAPSRVWRDTWQGLTSVDVEAYRRQVEIAGLEVVGLHSLFFDHPELGLFRDAETRARSLDFLVHLSAVCRDLGGRSLIWGGGRRRDGLETGEAHKEAVAFMGELCARIESHETVICFEPLGPDDSDFINMSEEAIHVADAVSHPAQQLQLDAKALVENGEDLMDTFARAGARLVHFHANEPGLRPLGESGTIPHARFSDCLREIGYARFVSIEQRMFSEDDAIDDITRSAQFLKEHYG